MNTEQIMKIGWENAIANLPNLIIAPLPNVLYNSTKSRLEEDTTLMDPNKTTDALHVISTLNMQYKAEEFWEVYNHLLSFHKVIIYKDWSNCLVQLLPDNEFKIRFATITINSVTVNNGS